MGTLTVDNLNTSAITATSLTGVATGKVVQVIQNFDDQYATYSNTSVDAQATVLSQAITPTAATSKILIQVNLIMFFLMVDINMRQ